MAAPVYWEESLPRVGLLSRRQSPKLAEDWTMCRFLYFQRKGERIWVPQAGVWPADVVTSQDWAVGEDRGRLWELEVHLRSPVVSPGSQAVVTALPEIIRQLLG